MPPLRRRHQRMSGRVEIQAESIEAGFHWLAWMRAKLSPACRYFDPGVERINPHFNQAGVRQSKEPKDLLASFMASCACGVRRDWDPSRDPVFIGGASQGPRTTARRRTAQESQQKRRSKR